MKRISVTLVTLLAAVSATLLVACAPSTIEESAGIDMENVISIPENLTGELTLPESSEYTIPEGAETGVNGGPGAMSTTAVDYSYFPEDKRPDENTESGTMVILYVPGSRGITNNFDYVDTIDAESLIEVLINNNAVTDDVEVESFEISEDGSSASLTISKATSVYEAASEDEVVAAIANTFIDNFSLKTISVSVTESGNTYDDMGFTYSDGDGQSTSEDATESSASDFPGDNP